MEIDPETLEIQNERQIARIEPTEEDKIYTAGFFDGEGYVGVYQAQTGINAGHYQLKCSVTNSNLAILQWIQARFGGAIRIKQAKLEKYQHIYHVTWVSANCKIFLQQIIPYLKIKKQQAEIALKFPLREIGHRGKRSAEMVEAQWRIYEALRQAKTIVNPIPQTYLTNLNYSEHEEHLRKKALAIQLSQEHPDWGYKRIGAAMGVSGTMAHKYLKGVKAQKNVISSQVEITS